MKKSFVASLLVFILLSSCGGNAGAGGTQTPTQAAVNPSNCTDAASFVADVTVPDNANFKPGDGVHKVWRVKNTGTCAWNAQYALKFASGNQMGGPASTPLSETKPGDTLDISADMTAPSKDGTYRADFELHNASDAAMPIDQAKTLWVAITVGAVIAAPSVISNSGSSGSASGLLTSTCGATTDDTRVNDVVTAINAYRSQNSLQPYTVNAQLTLAAQSHSEDMACNKLFVHTGSDGSTPSSRVTAASFVATAVTENVYGSYPPLSGHDVVSWWASDQTDPTHNLNLISTTYNEIGIGYAFFNNYGYFTVVFAAP
jgi:uncharacterized protein YkwD